MKYNENLRDNLKILRRFHKISAVQLSSELGMTNNRIGDIENQININIRQEELELLSNYFKVPIDALINKKATITFI